MNLGAMFCGAVLAIGLASCVTPADQMAMSDADDAQCMRWGFAMDTPDYGRCRVALAEQRAASSRERLANVRLALAQAAPASTPRQSSALPPAPTLRTTCFGRGERVSGMNKICFYDCLGSGHAVTQGAASLCPLTVER